MRRRGLIIAFVISTSLAFGQIESNSITVTASRSTNLLPDQVAFSIDIYSVVDSSFNDVLAALAGSGISTTNFSGVSTTSPFLSGRSSSLRPTFDWSFTLAVPWSQMKATIATLTALQQAVPQKNSALTLSFAVQGAQVSAQLQQMQTCSAADLLSDARAQAQTLANAANLFLGALLSMSSSTSTNTGFSSLPYFSISPACSLTVRFAVTR